MKKVRQLSKGRIALAGAALLALAGIVAFVVPARDWTELLERALEERNLAHALLVFGAAYVIGTLLMVPAWIFPIAAGAAFGPWWGMLAAVVCSTLAAAVAFLVARHLARARVERAAKRIETFQAVDKAVRREPFKVVALLRLSPVLPSGLKSYLLGLTTVKPHQYIVASALGMLPGLALKVYLGHIGRGAVDADGPMGWILLAAGIAATLALTFVVGRAVARRLGI